MYCIVFVVQILYQNLNYGGVKVSEAAKNYRRVSKVFSELQQLWGTNYDIFAVIKRVSKELNLDIAVEREKFILYGSKVDDSLCEDVVGSLIAVAPGVVILDAGHDRFLRPLSGLLVRTGAGKNISTYFHTKSFTDNYPAEVSIHSSGLQPKSKFTKCPACIYWSIGASQGTVYMRLGIGHGRWHEMIGWFHHWLPVD